MQSCRITVVYLYKNYRAQETKNIKYIKDPLPDDEKNHNSMFSHRNNENKCSSNLLILTLLFFKSLMSYKNSCQNTMNGWISISSITVFNLLIHTPQKSRTAAVS